MKIKTPASKTKVMVGTNLFMFNLLLFALAPFLTYFLVSIQEINLILLSVIIIVGMFIASIYTYSMIYTEDFFNRGKRTAFLFLLTLLAYLLAFVVYFFFPIPELSNNPSPAELSEQVLLFNVVSTFFTITILVFMVATWNFSDWIDILFTAARFPPSKSSSLMSRFGSLYFIAALLYQVSITINLLANSDFLVLVSVFLALFPLIFVSLGGLAQVSVGLRTLAGVNKLKFVSDPSLDGEQFMIDSLSQGSKSSIQSIFSKKDGVSESTVDKEKGKIVCSCGNEYPITTIHERCLQCDALLPKEL